MSLFTPAAAEAADLADLLAAHDYAIRLFRNDRTPQDDDTAADYVEASFPGYSAIVLTASDWTVTIGGPAAVASAPDQAWNQSADAPEQLIYGAVITRADTGELRRVDRFLGGPFAMARAGDRITISPRLTLRNLP